MCLGLADLPSANHLIPKLPFHRTSSAISKRSHPLLLHPAIVSWAQVKLLSGHANPPQGRSGPSPSPLPIIVHQPHITCHSPKSLPITSTHSIASAQNVPPFPLSTLKKPQSPIPGWVTQPHAFLELGIAFIIGLSTWHLIYLLLSAACPGHTLQMVLRDMGTGMDGSA